MSGGARQIVRIQSIDDPRIAPYRALKDRDLTNVGCGERFIAESEQVVRRLLASSCQVDSILLAEKRVETIAPIVPENVPVYVVADEMMRYVVGFKFHSGVLACGRRGEEKSVRSVVDSISTRAMLIVCPDVNNTENLGSLIRIAAGFGADAMILGPSCCDPFYRQSVRVSMGTIFKLPIVRSRDLSADLQTLRANKFQLIASVLDENAEPLAAAPRSDRIAILFGSEAHGLSREIVSQCDRHVTIPMRLGTDSLNVAIAAAVFMYHFTRE